MQGVTIKQLLTKNLFNYPKIQTDVRSSGILKIKG